MIIPMKVRIIDTKQLDRMFLRFIDKNGIVIESPSDMKQYTVVFAECSNKYFMDKLGEEND